MTYEEAIAWLDKAKGNAEALRMAREALEKQIPKKLTSKYGFLKGDCVCPSCETGLRFHIVVAGEKYCSECGQKILMVSKYD